MDRLAPRGLSCLVSSMTRHGIPRSQYLKSSLQTPRLRWTHQLARLRRANQVMRASREKIGTESVRVCGLSAPATMRSAQQPLPNASLRHFRTARQMRVSRAKVVSPVQVEATRKLRNELPHREYCARRVNEQRAVGNRSVAVPPSPAQRDRRADSEKWQHSGSGNNDR